MQKQYKLIPLFPIKSQLLQTDGPPCVVQVTSEFVSFTAEVRSYLIAQTKCSFTRLNVANNLAKFRLASRNYRITHPDRKQIP